MNDLNYSYAYARSQPMTFVLIHGSWANAGFWNGTAAALRQMGHTVHAPEYAGHGPNANKDVTHADITKSVVDYILAHQLRDFVLVGHSFGGSVIQKVAEQVPDRIKRLVFWDAFVVNDGEALIDNVPPQAQKFFLELANNSKDFTITLPFSYFRDAFVNTADYHTAQQLYKLTISEPAKPLVEKLDLKKFFSLNIPKSYLYLTEDNVLPQNEAYSWHPHLSGRLGQFRLIKGHGDHFVPAYHQPAKLAQLIVAAGRD
ncbi:pimeloyl-ACP methyl ester carboxylesterase [Paenibacillus phyllosphaerae]|uniref:Pimeloyl-ACP methyl ester carboxylesterase n=1 Tax=Paenibacillus phyllosphaerae TaxID=274593 RepID=A0A7W5AYS3_9BACL|nr:alpha/beta hydrolase [Paenibacillus phyllosphaerae]MBB3111232.1 pimeloyl-ACP methyl ester carboxylesterase [Paenibacillus phyllosphaerae]